MKFEQLEQEVIKLRCNKDLKGKMYSLILEITENDLNNTDIARKLIKNKKLENVIQQQKMINKLQVLFERKSANIDGDCSFETWMAYIED